MYDDLASKRKENPFYNNYVFSKEDLDRAIIKWWQYPFLWLLPTCIQCSEGYVFYFKYWQGKVFLMKIEKL